MWLGPAFALTGGMDLQHVTILGLALATTAGSAFADHEGPDCNYITRWEGPNATDISLHSSAGSYLVRWENTEDRRMYSATVDRDGTIEDQQKDVSTQQLVGGADGYLTFASWFERPNRSIRLDRLDRFGKQSYSHSIPISEDFPHHTKVVAEFTGESFVVAWVDGATAQHEIRTAIVSADGRTVSTTTLLSNIDHLHTVQRTGDVIWVLASRDSNLLGLRLDVNGNSLDSTPVVIASNLDTTDADLRDHMLISGAHSDEALVIIPTLDKPLDEYYGAGYVLAAEGVRVGPSAIGHEFKSHYTIAPRPDQDGYALLIQYRQDLFFSVDGILETDSQLPDLLTRNDHAVTVDDGVLVVVSKTTETNDDERTTTVALRKYDDAAGTTISEVVSLTQHEEGELDCPAAGDVVEGAVGCTTSNRQSSVWVVLAVACCFGLRRRRLGTHRDGVRVCRV